MKNGNPTGFTVSQMVFQLYHLVLSILPFSIFLKFYFLIQTNGFHETSDFQHALSYALVVAGGSQ
jgi:hypothetical protein